MIPKFRDGMLIKPFDSSYNEKTFILILKDKKWQVSEVIGYIALLVDGKRNLEEIALELKNKNSIKTDVDFIYKVVKDYFEQKGMLESSESEYDKKKGVSSYLWFKKPLLKSNYIEKLSFLKIFYIRSIFVGFTIFSIIMLLVLLKDFLNPLYYSKLLDVDLRIYLIFLLVGIFVVWFHEFGHVSASMKYGIKPGDIGIGMYFTMPVLYSDVSNTWQLIRKQRTVVDFGGIYFESIITALLGLVGIIWNNQTIYTIASLNCLAIFYNFNPFIKMDGYWAFSDITGIPNLHEKFGDFLESIFYRFLGIKKEPDIYKIKKPERYFFYGYVVGSFVFIGFFVYMFTLMLFATIQKTPQILKFPDINFVKYGFGTVFNNILTYTSKNFIAILFMISAVVVIYVSVRKINNSIVRIVQKYRMAMCLKSTNQLH